MTDTTHPGRTPTIRYPREIAARVTLGAAAAALVDPRPPGPGGCAAITTACAALATRLGLLEHVAGPGAALPVDGPAVPDAAGRPRADGAADSARAAGGTPAPVEHGLPPALLGVGTAPDHVRVERAGARCVDAWRRWATADGTAGDDPIGVAGALALAAWCAWATGASATAQIRARRALDLEPADPLAHLVLGWCHARRGPGWWSGSSTVD